MDLLDEKLNSFSGGRLLEAGAGEGGFIKRLIEQLKDFEQIIGIDISADNLKNAKTAVENDNLFLAAGDNGFLPFADSSFDTVTMRHTLHHLSDVEKTLSELKRVVRPGGVMLLIEMYQDKNKSYDNSYHQLHHWFADVDRSIGVSHNYTYTYTELMKLFNGLNLTDIELFEFKAPDMSPKEVRETERLWSRTDEKLSKIKKSKDKQSLYDRGVKIKKTIMAKGCRIDPELILFGTVEK